MRVVIFWIMGHLSLGHEKKALLKCFGETGKDSYGFYSC